MKSIIQDNYNICYICGKQATEEHHIFNGANRTKSEKYGLKVKLCHDCHNRDKKHHSVHFDKNIDLWLCKIGEEAYIKHYSKTKEEFLKEFKRNYL